MDYCVFLLSPARCAGKRADLLLNEQAQFDLACRLRTPGGAALGEVFSFLSGLYFRGKLAYAQTFGQAPQGVAPAQVITSHRGLLDWRTRVTLDDLRAMAEVPIALDEPRYVEPLQKSAKRLASRLPGAARIVLLGSVATAKYSQPLVETCGARLHFPSDFAGRGDMSRGGLLLRCVDEHAELRYERLCAAPRRGARPAKLTARRPPTASLDTGS